MNITIKLSLTPLLLFSSILSFSQSKIDFYNDAYIQALKSTKASNKILFVMVYDPECSHCNKMKKDVLTDTSVINFFSQHFINLMINGKSDSGQKFKQQYPIDGYPTFIFIDKNEVEVYNLSGEFKSTELINEANNALNPKTQVPYLQKQFYADTSNAENCYLYLNAIKRGTDYNKMEEITNKYLSTQSKEQLLSVTNWRIMSLGINDIHSKAFSFILTHQTEYASLTSPKITERKIISVARKSLRQDMERLDSVNYYKDRAMVQSIKLPAIDTLLFKDDLLITEYLKNWKQYRIIATELTEKYAWNDHKTLHEIALNFYANYFDPASINKAITWEKRANEFDNTYNSNYLIAKLYNKINDKPNAIKYAKIANKIADEMSLDKKEINILFLDLGIK